MSRSRNLMLLLALAASRASAAPTIAEVDVQGGVLVVRPLVSADSVSVVVTGPVGFVAMRVFGRGEAPELALAQGGSLADGLYLYEVRLNPAATRTRDEAGGSEAASAQALAQSGHFYVKGGLVPNATAGEPRAKLRARGPGQPSGAAFGEAPAPRSPDDFVIADDLVVQGRACVGVECVNPEVFVFGDSLVLKGQDNAIRVYDTSTFPGAPTSDWVLRFNDRADGGLNRFTVEDVNAGRIPMSILAGAPNNSLFVDATGRLGVRTGAPARAIHAVTGDSTGLRLAQDGSSGFTPQVWDVFGNESGFFIRDGTANTEPFVIRATAASNSIHVGFGGNVGIGTASAVSSLHVFRNNATAQLRVEEASVTNVGRNLARFINNGAATFRFDNSATASGWGFGSRNLGDFFISTIGAPAAQMSLNSAGNLNITGTYSSTSDRNAKADIAEVDASDVLAKLAALPLNTWRFKQGTERHLGPMAQDFSAAFGLGADDTHLAPSDVGGVALAAIQALKRQLDDKDAQIRSLNERLAVLESKLVTSPDAAR